MTVLLLQKLPLPEIDLLSEHQREQSTETDDSDPSKLEKDKDNNLPGT